MKKILVFSDSHGEVAYMGKFIKKEKPDLVIHLGDCKRDADQLCVYLPELKLEGVPGNCDMSQDPAERVLIEEGFRIFICHGHTRHVKSSYLNLIMAAQEKQADIALFGHTHNVYYTNHNGVILFNPGSIGSPPAGIPASYGVLQLDAETNTIKYDVRYLSDEA